MNQHLLRYLATLVVTVFACQNIAAKEPNQLFWAASKGTKTLFILGSIHVGNKNFYPLDPVIYQQLADSDALVVEVIDLESTETATYLKQIAQLARGAKITDGLSQNDIDRATILGNKLGIPFSSFLYKKTWYYSMVMTSMQSINMGYQPQWGIDLHLMQRAQQYGLLTIGLETSKQQLDIIDSIPLDASQFPLLLDELESADRMINQLIQAWSQGDLNSIELLMKKSFETSPDMEHILIQQRNILWQDRLNHLLKTYDNLFVVVGAGHLPGEQGLVNLLQKQGFNLETPL